MSDTIVEWLREMQDEYAPGGGGVQYHERYKEAADRLEELEAALREIVEVEDEEGEYYLTRALAEVKTIARKALGEEKP